MDIHVYIDMLFRSLNTIFSTLLDNDRSQKQYLNINYNEPKYLKLCRCTLEAKKIIIQKNKICPLLNIVHEEETLLRYIIYLELPHIYHS